MKALLVVSLVFLFVLLSTSTFDFFSPELQQDYFFPRSGDFLIFSESQKKKEFRARIVSHNVEFGLKEKTVEETVVADYFAHVNGLGVFNSDTNRKSFPSISYFERPSAQLVFLLDDIEEAEKLQLVEQGASSDVSTQTSSLSTPLSFLTTLLTGATPNQHGIISSRWWDNIFGTYVTAYTKDETTQVSGEAYKPNLGTLFSWTTRGQSLVASYAADYSVGASMAPHSKLVQKEKFSLSNLYSAYYAQDKQSIGNIYEEIPQPIPSQWTKETNLFSLEKLRALFPSPKFTFSQEDEKIIVRFNSVEVAFDLAVKSDEEFLVQFSIISALLRNIESKETLLLSDGVPDLYSFSLSGLQACKDNENKLMIVREMLNDFTLFVQIKIESFYPSGSKVATHLLLVEAHGDCQMAKAKKLELAQLLRSELGSQLSNEDDVEQTLPHVYLLPSLSVAQLNQIFFQIETSLKATDFKIHSPVDPLLLTTFTRQDSNSTSNGDDNDTVVYQTVLWSSVALAVAVLMAVYFICCMDTGQDTIIYRPVPHAHKA